MELEFARLQKLNELQAAIGYKFKDTELLNTAHTLMCRSSIRACGASSA